MVHKIKKEPAWKQGLRSVHDNPDYILQEMKALEHELKHNHPDPAYLREKARHINEWIDEIEKFQYGRE